MKRAIPYVILAGSIVLSNQASWAVSAQKVEYGDSWGRQGVSVDQTSRSGLDLTFSIKQFVFEEKEVGGGKAVAVKMSGSLLPIAAGYPDLPVVSQYVAVPKGATPSITVVAFREEKFSGVDIAPGMELPFDADREIKPLAKNAEIYSKNEFFPDDFVIQSPLQKMRGIDVFILSFSPFRYNPVTKELIVRRDMKISITFDGSTGQFGDDLYRHPLFEGVLKQNVINYRSIQPSKYAELTQVAAAAKETGEFEYIIIVPDDPAFIAWADTLKEFRKKQGIKTGVFTVTEIGGNTPAMVEAFVDNAYNNWTIKPLAVLMFSDLESTSKAYGLTSSTPIPHPSKTYPDYVSDNVFGDVDITDAASAWDNAGAPEMVFARMTAQTAAQCSIMVKKIINYESKPPASADFYNYPLSAAGWQDERWFGICSEIVRGFLKSKLAKATQQQYALVDASGPAEGDPWSTTDPSALVATYGPDGEGYITATVPAGMDWSSGTGAGVVNAVNNGCFMIMHRDHGNYYGWGEPAFTRTNILSLTNTDHTFVFSMNCQTGAFQYPDAETFSERFHRVLYGALGVICATQTSYSFVNDALIMGIVDGLWPDFNTGNNDVPSAGPGQTYEKYAEDLRPGFALVSGKWHLMSQSYTNTAIPEAYKGFTCHLFHLFGDPFMTFCSQIPDTFKLAFNNIIPCGSQTFSVNVKNQNGQDVPGALVGLYMPDNSPEIIISDAADESGNVSFTINPGVAGLLYVTVTKSNFVRHETYAEVTAGTPAKPNLVKLFDGARVPELKPTMSFYSVDPQENTVEYRILWDTTANFNSPVTDSFTTGACGSGETVTFTFPADLVEAWTYWWKVKGRDPSGSNVFGLESDVRSFTIGPELPAGTASWFHTKMSQFASDSCAGAAIVKTDSVVLVEPSIATAMLLNENFDASAVLPSGWSTNEIYGNNYDWAIGTSADVVNEPPDYDTYYAYISYPTTGPNATADADELITPFISLPDVKTGLALKYGVGYNSTQSGDSLSTWVRTSQAGAWQMAACRTASQTGTNDSINLAAYLPYDSIQVMWRFSSPGGKAGEDAAIDNVVISYNYIIYNTDGSLITGPIDYSQIAASSQSSRDSYGWGKIMWHKKQASDSIGIRIDYLNNGGWAPVPDAALPGNSGGFWDLASAVDSVSLNGLDTMVYDTLRAVALLCRPSSKATANPVLVSVEIARPGYMAATGIVTSDNDRTTPKIFNLGQAYPNPASGKVSIKYTLRTTGHTSLKVYNILGAEVKTLVNVRQDANAYTVTWDGKDNNGREVANGVYFYKLVSGEFTATKKMMLLK